MVLNDRSMGYELSNIEREIACNPKYKDVGYVRHDRGNGFFYLDYSQYLANTKNEIYYTDGTRPPEGMYADVRVEDEKNIILDTLGKKWVKLKTISGWKKFDVTLLATQRKILDYREVIEYFTYPYRRGKSDRVFSIASCSCLFAFSAPPVKKKTGGIGSAVYGMQHQWNAFKKPLGVIPPEFRKISSDVYYYISEKEKKINKLSGELNQAIRHPEKNIYDIPIIIDDVSQRPFLKDYQDSLSEMSKIIRAQLLDSYIIHPENMSKIEKDITETTYKMRDRYFSKRNCGFHQNIGDAIPKLASAYARLQTTSEIKDEDVKWVFDRWTEMFDEFSSRYSSPVGILKPLRFVRDTKNIYYKLCDIYTTENDFPIREAIYVIRADPLEFDLAVDSLVSEALAIRNGDYLKLLDP